MTNKEFLLKLQEARTPLWLDWLDDNTVLLRDPDGNYDISRVIFDELGNVKSVSKVLYSWELEDEEKRIKYEHSFLWDKNDPAFYKEV